MEGSQVLLSIGFETSCVQYFNLAVSGPGETCSAWVPWGDAFMGTDSSQLSRLLVGRGTYALTAVRLGQVYIKVFVNFRSYSSP